MTQPCVFCAIARGESAASFVYGDEQVMAFMDIRPVNPGHLLVAPLRHVTSLLDLDDETARQMFIVSKMAAGALMESGERLETFNLFLANGEAAGQTVPHLHIHVLPRYTGDGFGLRLGPHYGHLPERPVLDEIALRIRRAAGWE